MTASQSTSISTPRSRDTSGASDSRHRRIAHGIRPSAFVRVAALLLVSTLVLAACGDRGDVGIFAGIEREEKIEKSNLPENATAGSMVYDSSSGNYYVAMGRLFSRSSDESDWDEVDHPSGYDEGHTLDIVNVGGTVYAAFFETDSTKSELFELNTGNDNWNQVWDPGKEISNLIAVDTNNDGTNEELFAVTVESNKEDYNLVFAPGGAGSGTEDEVLSDVTKIFDGVHDGSSAYFFVSASQFWRSTSATDPATLAEETTTAPSGEGDFGGITFVTDAFNSAGDDRIYLSFKRGSVSYSTDGGGSWTTNNHDEDRRYTDPAYLDFAGFTGLVVGLDTQEQSSGGYYEVDSNLSSSGPDGDNYDAADIADASIHGFFVDTANNKLFALTNGLGLWQAVYEANEPEWSWE